MSIQFQTFSFFDRFPEITHFVTTIDGGVSKGKYKSLNLASHVGDDIACVEQNRKLICEALGVKKLIIPDQSHTSNVKVVVDGTEDLSDVDALITNQRGLCIGVLTADCVPILLYDPKQRVVAAIHAGWRGLIDGTVENTLYTFFNEYQSYPSEIVAAIGPCISKEQYEVGVEVSEKFIEKFPKTHPSIVFQTGEDKAKVDIRVAAQTILSKVEVSKIHTSTHCTYQESETYFSARRQGIESGRILSGIMLR